MVTQIFTWFRKCFQPLMKLTRRFFTPTKLIDINNDCLETIFEYLNLLDLLNVANSNIHLQCAAESVFYRKFRKIDIYFYPWIILVNFFHNDVIESSENHMQIKKLKTMLELLRYFGHMMQKLTINLSDRLPNREVIQYIKKYCSNSLTEITLYINAEDMDVSDLILSKVEKVKFVMCSRGLELSKYIRWFPNMREIFFCFGHFPQCIHIPHLEKCSIISRSCRMTNEGDIVKFVRLNPSIRSMHFDCPFNNVNIIKDVVHSLPQLENLYIHLSLKDLQNLNNPSIQHENVKVFTLRVYGNHHIDLFPFTFNRLEEFSLELDCDLNDQSIDFISKHSFIKKLSIDGLRKWPLLKIAKLLPSLREMSLTNLGVAARDAAEFLNECKSLKIFTFILENGSEFNRNKLQKQIGSEWKISCIGYLMRANEPTVKITRTF